MLHALALALPAPPVPPQDELWPLAQSVVGQATGAGSTFGHAAAIHGRWAAFGAPDEGTVRVFREDADGAWTETQLLKPDALAPEQFGDAVAMDGGVLIAGRPAFDVAGVFNVGAAYVYERANGTWTLADKLLASDGFQLDNFGCAVDVRGNRALVGARYDDDRGTSSGAAYVFERIGGVWTERAKLVASDGAAGDLAGWSVALGDDVAVVGAWGRSDAALFAGVAYVYEVDDAGTWTRTATLRPDVSEANGAFGVAVAADEEWVAVGATGQNDVTLFRRRAGGWESFQRLDRSGGQFGNAVALDGGALLAGAHKKYAYPSKTLGTAYLYRFAGGSWEEVQQLAPRGEAEQFGWALDVQGTRAAVSTPLVLAGRGEGFLFRRVGIEAPR